MDDVIEAKERIVGKQKAMKATVWDVLKDHPRARNDDRWLILKVLEAIGQNIVLGQEQVVWYIEYESFGDVPSFETITRVRREIQNDDGHWLPTDPEVIYRRKIKEAVIRQYYGADKPEIVEAWARKAYQVT